MSSDRTDLSRREREILDIVFALGEATSAQIRERLNNAPTGNAVRALIQILEDKGELVRLRKEGREFVFGPRENRGRAGLRAMKHVVETFYEGSVATALAAHLTKGKGELS
ncbi:MAG: crosslink repair DNA glycosylase YcaQ family protein, partial [Verrucomicrobiota bacterium]